MNTKSITIEVYGKDDLLLAEALKDAIRYIEAGKPVGCDLSPMQGFSFAVKKANDKR